jgi:hypothetical protein
VDIVVLALICARVSPGYMNQGQKRVGSPKISVTKVLTEFRDVTLVLGILGV